MKTCVQPPTAAAENTSRGQNSTAQLRDLGEQHAVGGNAASLLSSNTASIASGTSCVIVDWDQFEGCAGESLQPGTTYTVRVSARRARGDGGGDDGGEWAPWSASVDVRTPEALLPSTAESNSDRGAGAAPPQQHDADVTVSTAAAVANATTTRSTARSTGSFSSSLPRWVGGGGGVQQSMSSRFDEHVSRLALSIDTSETEAELRALCAWMRSAQRQEAGTISSAVAVTAVAATTTPSQIEATADLVAGEEVEHARREHDGEEEGEEEGEPPAPGTPESMVSPASAVAVARVASVRQQLQLHPLSHNKDDERQVQGQGQDREGVSAWYSEAVEEAWVTLQQLAVDRTGAAARRLQHAREVATLVERAVLDDARAREGGGGVRRACDEMDNGREGNANGEGNGEGIDATREAIKGGALELVEAVRAAHRCAKVAPSRHEEEGGEGGGETPRRTGSWEMAGDRWAGVEREVKGDGAGVDMDMVVAVLQEVCPDAHTAASAGAVRGAAGGILPGRVVGGALAMLQQRRLSVDADRTASRCAVDDARVALVAYERRSQEVSTEARGRAMEGARALDGYVNEIEREEREENR